MRNVSDGADDDDDANALVLIGCRLEGRMTEAYIPLLLLLVIVHRQKKGKPRGATKINQRRRKQASQIWLGRQEEWIRAKNKNKQRKGQSQKPACHLAVLVAWQKGGWGIITRWTTIDASWLALLVGMPAHTGKNGGKMTRRREGNAGMGMR